MIVGTPSINPNTDILDDERRDKLDGHMLFGDTQNGYCISIVFRLVRFDFSRNIRDKISR